jgi:hypothetical protein
MEKSNDALSREYSETHYKLFSFLQSKIDCGKDNGNGMKQIYFSQEDLACLEKLKNDLKKASKKLVDSVKQK